MPWGLIVGAAVGTGVGLAAGYNNGQRGWDLVGCGLAGGAIGGVAGLVLWDAPVLFAQDAFGFNVYQSIGNGLSTMGQGGAAAASQGASAASQITAGQGIAQGVLQTGSFVAQLALNDPGAGGAASQSDFNRWMQDQSMDQMYVDMMRQMREMTFADLTPVGGGMKIVKNAGRIAKAAQPAAEKTAVNMAKQIQRDLGPEARELFHDLKVGGDRTLQELKEHAAEVYKAFGGTPPKWMRP